MEMRKIFKSPLANHFSLVMQALDVYFFDWILTGSQAIRIER